MGGVAIILDEVTPLLQRVQTEAQARGLALVGARAVAQLVRTHLFGLNAERHRFGRNYYAQAARSVTTAFMPQGAVVSITQIGIRQRLKGGDINAKPGHKLTIPEADEAQGKRAREFKDLHIELRMNPEVGHLQLALVRNLSTPVSIRRRKQKDGSYQLTIARGVERGGEIMYWLTSSVHQKPDPTVLPHDEQMAATAVGAIKTRLLRPLADTSDGGTN